MLWKPHRVCTIRRSNEVTFKGDIMSKWVEAIKKANDEFADITEAEIQDRIDARIEGLQNAVNNMYLTLKEIKEVNDEYKKLPRKVRRQSKLKKNNEELLKRADKTIADIRFYEKVLDEAKRRRNDTTGS